MLKCLKSLLFLSLFFQFSCNDNDDQPDPVLPDAEFTDRVVTSGLSYPWELVWGSDNAIWMTERGGKVSRVNPETGTITIVATINEVESRGEGGLLGMALHPNFSSTPEVFLVYNYVTVGGEYSEKVVKYSYNGSALINPQVIFDGIGALNYHNGSRLVISDDLKLYITTGDAGTVQWAQDMSSPNGKVLRINLDGSIPADNPVSGNAVWSLGHRNAQGLVFAKGKLYSSEHGPEKDDEINIIQKGGNYGWPDVNGFCDEAGEQSFCNEKNVVEPLVSYTPTIAVSGMDYYDNAQIPQWKNSLLVATLKDRTLYQFKLNEAGTEIIETNEFYRGEYGRLRDVLVAPNGKVYIATSNGSDDKIIEISRGN
ncbi:PQQ-dependent sugar dehydrogenase [Pontibacter populi]|uniref:PQQ-dependent sugar dehydrogenase n=1 Tax=Pontibacter populi TaxID=890055 RepID=A0ABV1RTK6_9BACT